MKRLPILAATIAALVMLSSSAPPAGAQMSGQQEAARAQADAFLAQAALALDSGSATLARPLVDSALELAPGYSEGLFLRARLELMDRSATLPAIADLRAALSQGTWKSTDPAAARQTLAEALLHAGRPSEARPLLESLTTLHPEDPRNTLLLARTFAKSGDLAREKKVLSDAAVRFPLEDDFRLLSAALFAREGRSAEARDIVAIGLKVHPQSLPLLLASARLESSPRARLAAVDRYLENGGNDPLGPVLALESSPKDRQKYLGLFLGQGGLAHEDLVNRVAAAVRGRKDLSGSLREALASYTGTRDLDADEDGFWEDRWTFDKGAVTDWVHEPLQDGVAQYAARFVKDSPVSFNYSSEAGTKVTLTFSTYPYIESASETTAQTAQGMQGSKTGARAARSTLFLVPYTVQCIFLQTAGAAVPGFAPRLAARFRIPSLQELQKGAYRREEYSGDGVTLLRRIELSRGKIVYLEEDSDGDGRLDHRVWFADGQPVRGERSLTGDGVYPIKETWRGGKLVQEKIAGLHGIDPLSPGTNRHNNRSGQGGTFVRESAASIEHQGTGSFEAVE